MSRGAARRTAGPVVEKKKKGKKKKESPLSGLFLALVTLVNLSLSVVLYVLRRRDIVQAVESDEGVKLLLTRPKETKTGEK